VKRIFGCFLGYVLLAAPVAPIQAKPSAHRPFAKITVRVQNNVRASSTSLARAEELASEILREAGVQVVWLDCDDAVAAEGRSTGCAQPLGSTDFVLIVVDKIQVLSPTLQASTLGIALLPQDAGLGYVAYICYGHAKEVAHKSAVAVERVLGIGIAHELGHLLLGENAHSP